MLILLLLGVGLSAGAQAQPDTLRVATERLRVELDRASGAMALAVRASDTTWRRTEVPGMVVDGRLQGGVRVENEAPDLTAEGATVRYDADGNRTVLRFSSFRGGRTLTWTDPASDH